jgi:hypothetical protein
MAVEADIGGAGELFVGEDKTFRLELLDTALTTPVDMAGWVVKFFVRLKDGTADPAIFDKTATIIGVYNSVRATNTQRAEVTLTDTELNTVTAKTHRYSWKRMDDGNETVLAYGDFVVQLATAR